MAVDHFRYDLLAQDALRNMVRQVLQQVARDGLPGEHHFFITFDTRAAGVQISPRLHERYPQEMTIVLQHQFWDLVVSEVGLEVGLSFTGIPERLSVPFTALTQFVDPSVPFGLKFEVAGEIAETATETPPEPALVEAPPPVELAKPRGSVPAARAKSAPPAAEPAAATPAAAETPPAEGGATVVRLDSFRKK